MPTYEYECRKCGLRFEQQQPITDRLNTEPDRVPWNNPAKPVAVGTIVAANRRVGTGNESAADAPESESTLAIIAELIYNGICQ